MPRLNLPGCKPGPTRRCPLCGANAVLELTDELQADQQDGTTHVCHPLVLGCNHGFELQTVLQDTGERVEREPHPPHSPAAWRTCSVCVDAHGDGG
jgi:hypothetical protein